MLRPHRSLIRLFHAALIAHSTLCSVEAVSRLRSGFIGAVPPASGTTSRQHILVAPTALSRNSHFFDHALTLDAKRFATSLLFSKKDGMKLQSSKRQPIGEIFNEQPGGHEEKAIAKDYIDGAQGSRDPALRRKSGVMGLGDTAEEQMELSREEVLELILENLQLLKSVAPEVMKKKTAGSGNDHKGGSDTVPLSSYTEATLQALADEDLEDIFERVIGALEGLSPRQQMIAEILADPSLLPDNLRGAKNLEWLRKDATLDEVEEIFDQYYAWDDDDDGDDEDDDDAESGTETDLERRDARSLDRLRAQGDVSIEEWSDTDAEDEVDSLDSTRILDMDATTLEGRYGLTRESAAELIVDNQNLLESAMSLPPDSEIGVVEKEVLSRYQDKLKDKTTLMTMPEEDILAIVEAVVVGFQAEAEKGEQQLGDAKPSESFS